MLVCSPVEAYNQATYFTNFAAESLNKAAELKSILSGVQDPVKRAFLKRQIVALIDEARRNKAVADNFKNIAVNLERQPVEDAFSRQIKEQYTNRQINDARKSAEDFFTSMGAPMSH